MAETLKFGPQWLHNLIDGPSNTTSPPAVGPSVSTLGYPPAGQGGPAPGRYKLAEHRYGREEMLALYVPAPKIPESLRQFQSILKEQSLQPMAFIPPSEDEQRLMSQSVNSVAVLRMMGRGAGPSQRGGRGGGDRGRGRGRGRGEGGFSGFHRQTSLEDDGYGRGRHGGRGDVWEEGDKQPPRGFERGAIGFGGPRSAAFEDGPTSPRREFSRSMSSDNWRDARSKGSTEDEEEGGDWRRAGPRDKWGSRGSWRDHRERDRDREYGRSYDDYDGGHYQRPYRTKSGSWGDGPESDIPEWSMPEADDVDNIGTFDSSGAFMFIQGKDMDEKEQRRLFEAGRQRALAQAQARREKAAAEKQDADIGAENDDKEESSAEPEKDQPSKKETPEKKSADDAAPPSKRAEGSKKDSRSVSPQPSKGQASSKEGSPSEPEIVPDRATPSSTTPPQAVQEQVREPSPKPPQQSPPNNIPPQPVEKEEVANYAHKPGMPNDQADRAGQQTMKTQVAAPHRLPGQAPVEDDFGHLEKAAEDLVATWTAEEDAKSDSKAKVESGGVPVDHEDAKKWFYRDPQGDMQGPFKAAEMAEWFSAGYFTMNLLVKRGCDTTFQALGELIKRWGRVPFLPGPSPPPFKDISAGIPAAAPAPAPPQQMDPQQEQMKMLQQQMMLQQQYYMQQMQMSQMIAQLQQQESFAKMSTQQQQQIALQLLLKQQQQMMQQPPQPPQQSQPAPTEQQSPPPQQAPSLSPRSEQQVAFQRQMSQQQQQAAQQQAQQHREREAVAAREAAAREAVAAAAAHHAAAAQQQQAQAPGMIPQTSDAGVTGFHRSMSQPHTEENTIWGNASNPTAVSSAGWTAPTSVWDIEPPKTQSLEEIQRLERMKIEQQQREEADRREQERRRLEQEELRKRQEEEERRRQEEEIRRRQEEERRKQVEMELERQRMEQLERIRLQREAEENSRREEERRRREEEDRRRREEEERRLREAEERRRQIEEQRRKEQEEMERKRQEEIRRRQEKEEMRRQQQEALRRIQQEQMANMQLPSTVQWANSSSNPQGNGAPSLSEIQEMEAKRAVKEAEENKRRLEQQRQQLAAIQQQQQAQTKTWAQQTARSVVQGGSGAATPTNSAPSLLEIQQEQAMQLERDKQRQQQQTKASPTASLPLRTAAVWSGASQASHWAAEGAWGNQNRTSSAGFWDDAIGGASKKQAQQAPPTNNSNANSNFPTLSSAVSPQQAAASTKSKSAKAKREEESVQRLFQQAMKPKDEFTQWCENALRGIQSSVDVPTFIVFLQDVESPYEVHDYVRSYLGESKDATEFATQFLERRSKYKNHLKQEAPEEMWGPAPAVNPNLKNDEHRSSSNNNGSANSSSTSASKNASKKKKQRMQKVDASILGFTVHADPERVNMGDIEPIA